MTINDHRDLVSAIERSLTRGYGRGDEGVLCGMEVVHQHARRCHWFQMPTNAKDAAEYRGEPLGFSRDKLPLTGPPMAWTILCGPGYYNIYGEGMPRSLQRWGYVIWDGRRWIGHRGGELILRAWRSRDYSIAEMLRIDETHINAVL